MIPNFLVLGVKKAGTTWLYNLLKSHRQIYVPKYRKEVHFFDWNYSKGLNWYKSFFPRQTSNGRYKAVGEATPGYLFNESSPDRVEEVMPDGKFIIILRNPVDRLISAYTYYKQRGGQNSFKTFSKPGSKPFQMGLYSEQLKTWFNRFDRDQFLILLFEECINDPQMTKKKLADFLEIDINDFQTEAEQPKNASFKVRLKNLYLMGVKSAVFLRKLRLDYLIYIFRLTGLMEIFKDDEEVMIAIEDEKKAELLARYQNDIVEVERMLGMDLSQWKKSYSASES